MERNEILKAKKQTSPQTVQPDWRECHPGDRVEAWGANDARCEPLAPLVLVLHTGATTVLLTFGAPPKQPRPGQGSGQERRRYKAKSALTRHQSHQDTNRTKMKVQRAGVKTSETDLFQRLNFSGFRVLRPARPGQGGPRCHLPPIRQQRRCPHFHQV